MRRIALIGLAGLTLFAVAPAAADTVGIRVNDNFFTPVPREAGAGDTIRFRWVDEDNPHSVKFTKVPRGVDKPRSCTIRTEGACKRKLPKAGTYRYKCTIHGDSEGMRGRIVVGG